jgi:hypothetical protein
MLLEESKCVHCRLGSPHSEGPDCGAIDVLSHIEYCEECRGGRCFAKQAYDAGLWDLYIAREKQKLEKDALMEQARAKMDE